MREPEPEGDLLDAFKGATASPAVPVGLRARVMSGLIEHAARRRRAERRFLRTSLSIAGGVALASLGLALWQEARLVDRVAHSADVWLDGEVREP